MVYFFPFFYEKQTPDPETPTSMPRELPASELGNNYETDWKKEAERLGWDQLKNVRTKKYFRNLFNPNQIWIVIRLFR